MTKAEWYRLATELQARWPNKEIPEESVEIWYEDLKRCEAEQVRAAIVAFYREGREWPPNSGQILAKLAELQRDDPSHGEAWRLVNKALRKHGVYDWPGFYRFLEGHSPAIAEAARRYGFEPHGYLLDEETTVRAQFRDIYNAVCAERKRDDAYAGLPSAGLRRLERGPRPIGEALSRALPERAR